MKGRIVEIDVAKGMLVILVVVGHAWQQYGTSLGYGWGMVRTVIYAFHMAAFVFIAGFCSNGAMAFKSCSDVLSYFQSRAFRLLLPYVTWGGCYFALRAVAGDLARIPYDRGHVVFFLLGYNPDGAMWFLWTLFAASVVVVPFARFVSRGWLVVALWAVAAVYVKNQTIAPHLTGVNALLVFAFFLAFGMFARLRFERFSPLLGNVYFAGSILAMFALACYARQTGWCAQVPWYVVSAPAGTILTMIMARVAVRSNVVVTDMLAFLGRHAMVVYVLGEPVKVVLRIAFAWLGMASQISFHAMIVMTLVVSIVAYRLLVCRSRILSALLLGMKASDIGKP